MVTNAEMEGMLAALEPLLERTDILGYAAARNTRLLEGELIEFRAKRNELIAEYGEAELDDDGEPTGRTVVTPDAPRFGDFAAKLEELAAIEHDPQLFRVPWAKAIGVLSGRQMLQLEWLFDDEED